MKLLASGVALAAMVLCVSCGSSDSSGSGAGKAKLGGTAQGFDPCKLNVEKLSAAIGTPLRNTGNHADAEIDDVVDTTCQWSSPESDTIGTVQIGSYRGSRSTAAEIYKSFCESSTDAAGLPAGSFVCMRAGKQRVYVVADDPFDVSIDIDTGTSLDLELKVAKAVLAST